MACRRAGFTLVEVMVALVVSAIVIAGGRAVLGELGDGERRLAAAARDTDREANADRVLRTLLDRVEAGTDAGARFEGDEATMRFRSWCDVPRGWAERCEVVLGVDSVRGAPVLAAALSTGELVVLRARFTSAELRYLADARDGGRWLERWGGGLTAPVAVGIVVDGDTTIVRIGERG